MNWIKKIMYRFASEEMKKQMQEQLLADARKRFCEYTENPFSTSMQNYMQRIKCPDSPTGWGVRMLKPEEIKQRLDNGICWLDYPALDENGKEIEGVTGINFH